MDSLESFSHHPIRIFTLMNYEVGDALTLIQLLTNYISEVGLEQEAELIWITCNAELT